MQETVYITNTARLTVECALHNRWVTVGSRHIEEAVSEIIYPCTVQVGNPIGRSPSINTVIVGTAKASQSCMEPHLSADKVGYQRAPVTRRCEQVPPLATDKELHSTLFKGSASNQPNVSTGGTCSQQKGVEHQAVCLWA